MVESNKKKAQLRLRPLAIAIGVHCLTIGGAQAFEFDTGNSDVSVRWDNTLRYNLAQRVEGRNNSIANDPKFDEGDYKFDRGDLVANRIDLLSELDVVYKKNFGFRLSGAGWYDAAYNDKAVTNPNLRDAFGQPVPSSYVGSQYSGYTKRYYVGPAGELLDAFVFTNFDAGSAAVKARLGRHSVVWGESLFLGGAIHSVSYSQVPLDLQKGFATPGVEAKELFRPLNQISTQVQLTNELSVAAQYFLEWENFRFPEGGTYLGPADFAFNGPDRIVLATHPAAGGLGYTRGDAVTPKNTGEFGLNTRWSPEFLDGTLGVYYRRYADKIPQVLVTSLAAVGGQPLAAKSQYQAIYADKIDLFGISLAKSVGGVSVGAELSYRHNTPLLSQTLGNASATGTPSQGDTPGPRGNTVHALTNLMGNIASTDFFDAASWATEVTWARWTGISSGANLFNGVGYNGCRGPSAAAASGDKWDGCATHDFIGLAVAFTPTWYQVFPGVDLSLPANYSTGLMGNAPVAFGGNEGLGNYSVGIAADIFQKYRVDLKYVDYFGKYRTNAAGNITTFNGFTTVLSDRGFASLTLKTTF
ncbi:MAG TPA: DUF1302 domain-containing protein [Rhodocyclaceae bacterium]|nr:DUF1302 domain-containing protein [Rhodocyclaceae bacterium]